MSIDQDALKSALARVAAQPKLTRGDTLRLTQAELEHFARQGKIAPAFFWDYWKNVMPHDNVLDDTRTSTGPQPTLLKCQICKRR